MEVVTNVFFFFLALSLGRRHTDLSASRSVAI
uniref:Uncharacterized protein n=1 Tax=Anguilla anguilla TaxID=7936 RepID=A0A0E9S415_ANGAN